MSTTASAALWQMPAVLVRVRAWMDGPSLPGPPPEMRIDLPDTTDAACMARLAGGDMGALRPIFDRWKLPLLSYFYRSLGSRADAEDLALQTFERLYRAAGRYRPEAAFPSWLFAIARGELLHELRRRRRKPVVPVPPDDLDGIDPAPAPGRELEEILLVALQELPERQRSAVILAAAGELGLAEIARTLGVSLNNLHVILHRARAALRARFTRLAT